MTNFKELGTLSAEKVMEVLGPKVGYSSDDIEMFGAVLDTIHTIGEKKIRPHIMEWEEEGVRVENGRAIIPETMEKVLKELIVDNELNAFFIPKELGGYGFTNVAQGMLSETLSQYDISFQILSFISLSVMEAMVVYYKENFAPILEKFAKGEYTGYVGFTEPQAGSNLANVKSTSELDGDEYVLNGTKIFISNGGYANCGLILTRNMVNGKQEGHNVFVVEGLDGIVAERVEHKSGLKANPTAQLHFENLRVPKENIIAQVGKGYKKVLERLMGMRLGVTFQGIGATTRALELAKQYAEERVQFKKPIISFPGVANKIKEIERTLPRMRAYGFQAALALDRFYKGYIPFEVGATGDASEKMAAQSLPSPLIAGLSHYMVSSAKFYTSEMVNMIAYDAQQVFGGNGFIAEYEINKIARDVRVLSVYEGTSEIHAFIVDKAQEAFGMLPKGKFTPLGQQYDDKTRYEKMLYLKFPEMEGKI